MKPRIALVADVEGWAFDIDNHDMAKYVGENFDFSHHYVSGWERLDLWGIDMVWAPYRWALCSRIGKTPLFGSLRSRDFNPEAPGTVSAHDIDYMNHCSGFHVVNRDKYDELKKYCEHLTYLTNAVDMDKYPKASEVTEPICSWNGNARHPRRGAVDVKGFFTIIGPAIDKAGVRLNAAEYGTTRKAPEEMPAFYQESSIALCASLYEGASNSVMEALASGLAMIATDVGNNREMHQSMIEHYGDSGIMLVDRNIESFVEAIETLKANPARIKEMGALNRKEIIDRWSWEIWGPRYKDALNDALERAHAA